MIENSQRKMKMMIAAISVAIVGVAITTYFFKGASNGVRSISSTGPATTAPQGASLPGTTGAMSGSNGGSNAVATMTANGQVIGSQAPTAGTPNSVANGAANIANSGTTSNGAANVAGTSNVNGAAPIVAGAPSVTSTGGTVTSIVPNTVVAAPPAPLTCSTMNFHHKMVSGHSDADACSRHRNVIRLKFADINRKSLCVRVDGVPVKYDTAVNKDGLTITVGAIAGPASRISARFGIGKVTCSEDCTIPKDEFMEAIGGDDVKDAKAEKIAKGPRGKKDHWDANENGKDAEVSADLEEEIEKEISGGNESQLVAFDGWLQDSETAALR